MTGELIFWLIVAVASLLALWFIVGRKCRIQWPLYVQLRDNVAEFDKKAKESGRAKMVDELMAKCVEASRNGLYSYEFEMKGDFEDFMCIKARCQRERIRMIPDNYASLMPTTLNPEHNKVVLSWS